MLQRVPEYNQYYRVFQNTFYTTRCSRIHSILNTTGSSIKKSILQGDPEYTQYYRVFHNTYNSTGCSIIHTILQVFQNTLNATGV